MARKIGTKNKKTVEQRFMEKVTEDNFGCWDFKGKYPNSIFYIDRGIRKNSKQVAWYLKYGHLPTGELYSLCKNKRCVNPIHHIEINSWEDRFWFYVNKSNDSDCWNWIGDRDIKGYGLLNHKYSTKAHRLSWLIHNGEIPDGLLVCHRCDNPSCVNPKHLFLGTIRDNNLDKEKKGRHRGARGERNFGAVLTEKQVSTIRFLYGTGKYSTYSLSDIFMVSRNAISNIINNKTWRYIDGT